MARFSADVSRMDDEGGLRLWQARTGRSMRISAEGILQVEAWDPATSAPMPIRALVGRLDAMRLLDRGPVDYGAMIPARSRLVLLLPEIPALWYPVPGVRTPGGFAYAERGLSADELALWRVFNGARTVRAAAALVGVDPGVALDFLEALTGPETQVAQLRDSPPHPRDLSLERLVAPPRPASPRPPDQRGMEGSTDLRHYHSVEIVDGKTHFDDRETTVAHAFAVPHPGLAGQPYGVRLFDTMARMGLLPAAGGAVLEVGSGDGELGEAWRAAASAAGRLPTEHLRLDLSPVLLETSGRRQPGTRGVLGSATEMPFADCSLDLVICNEVIADLSAVPSDRAEAVAARMQRYGLERLPEGAQYNLGAWIFLEELARTLRPGGVALISEFGELDEAPQETEQLDHPEVSIHFGHLLAVARGLGLQAEVLPLAEFLAVDLATTWLSRWSYEALRARLRSEGHTLAARAWTPETLTLPWAVEGLHWVSLADPGPGPLITRFFVLVLRRER